MNITVQFEAQAKRAVGTGCETLSVDDSHTIREVLQTLANRHGQGLREIVLDGNGGINRALLLFVGDQQSVDLEASLADGDTLTIMPPVSGG